MHLVGFNIRIAAFFYIMQCRLPEEHLRSAVVTTQNLLKYLLNTVLLISRKPEIYKNRNKQNIITFSLLPHCLYNTEKYLTKVHSTAGQYTFVLLLPGHP
jgi:hypothetical protein